MSRDRSRRSAVYWQQQVDTEQHPHPGGETPAPPAEKNRHPLAEHYRPTPLHNGGGPAVAGSTTDRHRTRPTVASDSGVRH